MKLRILGAGMVMLIVMSTAVAQSKFEDKVGEQTLETMAKTQGFYEDPALLKFVENVGKRLEAQMPENGYDFKYHLVDVEEPNAFATAGGYVYVTRGLLAIIDTEDELACVLGHEFTHVLHKHSNKKMEREILPTLLEIPGNLVGSLMAQSVGALMNLPIEATSKSVNSIFDRKQENDADENGVQLAAKAGYNPQALISALNKLEMYVVAQGGTSDRFSIFDNHPLTSKRVVHIQEVISGIDYTPKKQLHILGRTDGIVLGPNPRSGVITKKKQFLHPDMNFSIQFPEKWKIQNVPAALTAIGEKHSAGLAVGYDGKHAICKEAANAYLEELDSKKLKVILTESIKINGFEAAQLELQHAKGGGAQNIVVWVKLNDSPGVLQISGTAKDEGGYELIKSIINSLRKIEEEEGKLITEKVMRFEKAQEVTLQEYGESKGADKNGMVWLQILNDLSPDEKITGEYVKYVEERLYPVSR